MPVLKIKLTKDENHYIADPISLSGSPYCSNFGTSKEQTLGNLIRYIKLNHDHIREGQLFPITDIEIIDETGED